MSNLEWRAIPIAPGYEASSAGQIRSVKRRQPHVMRARANVRHGYLYVDAFRDGKTWQPMVHRLVASAFLGPRPDGMQVRHLDGNQTNNAADNLRYGTPSENEQDKASHGTALQQRSHCAAGHPFDETNTTYFKQWRRCRTCYSANQRRAYLRRREQEVA